MHVQRIQCPRAASTQGRGRQRQVSAEGPVRRPRLGKPGWSRETRSRQFRHCVGLDQDGEVRVTIEDRARLSEVAGASETDRLRQLMIGCGERRG